MLETLIGILGFLGLIIVLLAYDALCWGLVGYKFWYWFLLPIFPTLPAIVFWQAVGLMFFIALFKSAGQVIKKEYKDENAQMLLTFILPWITLLCGWVTYAWIIPKLAH